MSPCMDFRCSNDVSICNSTLATSYDTFDNAPCCTHILRDMLSVFDESMLNLGLNYFVGFGTLLGLTRSDRVIPWTIDNDIVVDKRTFRAVTELWNVDTTGLSLIFPKSAKKQRGSPRMCVTPQWAHGKLQKWQIPTPLGVLFHDRGFPYIDFYFGEDMEQNTYGKE